MNHSKEMKKYQKIVLTGGPGSGKTTVLNTLGKMGYTIFPELSRQWIHLAQQAGTNHYFEEKPLEFSAVLLEGRIQQYQEAEQSTSDKIFLDRGIPDVFAYLDHRGQAHTFNKNTLQKYRYDQVFFFPPWKDIYTADAERQETFEKAQAIGEHLNNYYSLLGYHPIRIPEGSVEERCNFLLKQLTHG